MTQITTPDTDITIYNRVLKGRSLRFILGETLTLSTGTPDGNGVAEASDSADDVRAAVLAAEFRGKAWYTRGEFGPLEEPSQNGSNEAETDFVSTTAVVDEATTIGFHAVLLESADHELSAFNSMGGPRAATANSAANTIQVPGADFTALIGEIVPFVLSTDGGTLPTGLTANISYGMVDDAMTLTPVISQTDMTPLDFTTDGSNLYFHPAQGRLMHLEILDTPETRNAGQGYGFDFKMFTNGTARSV